ncbi:RNA polymerase sigma factor [Haliea atlantica]
MPSLSEQQRADLLDELAPLRRFCLSLTGAAADADDLLQVTVERVLDKGMPADADARKWAYRVCKNAWIDELRSREVRQRYPQQAAGDEEAEAPSAEDSAVGERALEAISRALDRLPDEQRLALTLVAVEGKSYAEAAEILEVPVGTIMSRIARARRHLLDNRSLQRAVER